MSRDGDGAIVKFMNHFTRVMAAVVWVALVAGAGAQSSHWTIPPNANTLKSTVKAGPETLKAGRTIYMARCRKCHGPEGKGNGAQADPNHKPADLTGSKADQNPDGVLFHKIGGGSPPDMPAFKGQLAPDEIWTVVEYIKSLRKG